MPSGVNIALFEAILTIWKTQFQPENCTFDFTVLKYIELMTPDAFLKHQLFVYLHL